MSLPHNLQQAVEAEIEQFGFHDVLEAREELTDRYRQRTKKKNEFMTTEAHHLAYAAARLPATYAVVRHVLEELLRRRPDASVKSLCDLGSGPGTVLWAAHDLFPEVAEIRLYEKDTALAALGKRLCAYESSFNNRNIDRVSGDLRDLRELPSADLVVLSYSIGELPEASVDSLIETAWQATGQFLTVIEPGTPAGFARIRAVRDRLIARGSYLVAPCPHAFTCPVVGGDWCHFAQRIERSSIHRRLKKGTLGYEDEKFSYITVSKTPCKVAQTRILRSPAKHGGHVSLTLCTPEGIKNTTVSKRTPEAYRRARKAEWGSEFVEDVFE